MSVCCDTVFGSDPAPEEGVKTDPSCGDTGCNSFHALGVLVHASILVVLVLQRLVKDAMEKQPSIRTIVLNVSIASHLIWIVRSILLLTGDGSPVALMGVFYAVPPSIILVSLVLMSRLMLGIGTSVFTDERAVPLTDRYAWLRYATPVLAVLAVLTSIGMMVGYASAAEWWVQYGGPIIYAVVLGVLVIAFAWFAKGLRDLLVAIQVPVSASRLRSEPATPPVSKSAIFNPNKFYELPRRTVLAAVAVVLMAVLVPILHGVGTQGAFFYVASELFGRSALVSLQFSILALFYRPVGELFARAQPKPEAVAGAGVEASQPAARSRAQMMQLRASDASLAGAMSAYVQEAAAQYRDRSRSMTTLQRMVEVRPVSKVFPVPPLPEAPGTDPDATDTTPIALEHPPQAMQAATSPAAVPTIVVAAVGTNQGEAAVLEAHNNVPTHTRATVSAAQAPGVGSGSVDVAAAAGSARKAMSSRGSKRSRRSSSAGSARQAQPSQPGGLATTAPESRPISFTSVMSYDATESSFGSGVVITDAMRLRPAKQFLPPPKESVARRAARRYAFKASHDGRSPPPADPPRMMMAARHRMFESSEDDDEDLELMAALEQSMLEARITELEAAVEKDKETEAARKTQRGSARMRASPHGSIGHRRAQRQGSQRTAHATPPRSHKHKAPQRQRSVTETPRADGAAPNMEKEQALALRSYQRAHGRRPTSIGTPRWLPDQLIR